MNNIITVFLLLPPLAIFLHYTGGEGHTDKVLCVVLVNVWVRLLLPHWQDTTITATLLLLLWQTSWWWGGLGWMRMITQQ